MELMKCHFLGSEGLVVFVCVCVSEGGLRGMQLRMVTLHPNILEHNPAVFIFCLLSVFSLEAAVFVTL